MASSAARGLQNVRAKAGTFVLATVLIAMVGVFLSGRAQGWFEEKLDVQTSSISLAADSTLGLEEGAEVQILGNTVGYVTEVKLENGTAVPASSEVKMHFKMRVRGPLMKLVRRDSVVQIRKKFGVAGSAYILITAGQGQLVAPDTKLNCVIAPDITSTLEDTLRNLNRPDGPVQTILANAATVTSNLASGKGTAGSLINDGEMARQLTATLANVQTITAGLTRNEGPVGRLLHDDKTGEQLTGAMVNINQSLESVNKLLARTQSADINGFMDQLRQTLGQVDATLKEVTLTTAMLRQQAKDLPGLLAQSQEMMRQTTRMIEGMQKTWLLRDHVSAEGTYKLSPSDVTAP